MQSMKERALAAYHKQIAEAQERRLLTWDFPRMLCDMIAVDPEDLDSSTLADIIEIARGIFWSEPFHIMAKGLADAVRADMESVRRDYVFEHNIDPIPGAIVDADFDPEG